MKRRLRVSIIVGVATFALLAALTPASALWNVDATITTAVSTGDTSGCGATGLTNGGFEAPAVQETFSTAQTPSNWTWVNADNGATVTGEMWNTPTATTFYAPQGEQVIELNANEKGEISQSLATVPGQTLGWSFYHKGRNRNSGAVETVRVSIGAPGALADQGEFSVFNTGTAVGWRVQSGTYVVPAGQTQTRLTITSTSGSTTTPSDGAGNVLDGIALGVGPCVSSTSMVTEVGGTAGSYVVGDRVRVSTLMSNTGTAPGLATAYAYTLPAGLELVSGTLAITDPAKGNTPGASTASYDTTTRAISANIGDRPLEHIPAGRIFPGAAITLTFDAIIQASASGTTVNYAPAVTTSSQLAPTWAIDASPANVPIAVTAPSADIALSALTTPFNATAGTQTTWTFRATNNGPSAAVGTSIALTIPPELTSVVVQYSNSNDAATSPVTCTVSGTSATCPISGAFASGQIRRVWVRGTIPANYVATTNPRTMTVNATATTTSTDAVSTNNTLAYSATVATGPSTPTNLRTNGTVTRTSVPLIWNASTAAAGIKGYEIYRDGTTLVGTVTGTATTFTVTNTGGAGSHFFQVRALDNGGRGSAYSNPELRLTIP